MHALMTHNVYVILVKLSLHLFTFIHSASHFSLDFSKINFVVTFLPSDSHLSSTLLDCIP